MLRGMKRSSTNKTTTGSKKKKTTTNAPGNGPAGRVTRASTTAREDPDEPLTRSDIPVLIQEVVNTLSAQRSADQAAGLPDIVDGEESSSPGTTRQMSTVTGKFNISVR